jgi:hypothetical protein
MTGDWQGFNISWIFVDQIDLSELTRPLMSDRGLKPPIHMIWEPARMRQEGS